MGPAKRWASAGIVLLAVLFLLLPRAENWEPTASPAATLAVSPLSQPPSGLWKAGFRQEPGGGPVTDQVVVEFRSRTRGARLAHAAAAAFDAAGGRGVPQAGRALAEQLSKSVGEELRYVSALSGTRHVFRLVGESGAAASWLPERWNRLQRLTERLRGLPDVAEVEEDALVFPARVPGDARFPDQWYLRSEPGGVGIDAVGAWDRTIGAESVTIAVVDSGITTHTEFAGRVLPGYDFVSDPQRANDGDGRDGDAADPGDFVTEADAATPAFRGCTVADSSWHGTRVAGVAAASGDNGAGVAGLAWGARILPVRVLGKCGGYLSDVAAGVMWAAGGRVLGAPENAHPARVINLSVGGFTYCGASLQYAINTAVRNGATVVAAAGNSAADAGTSAPGNCQGVVAVAAVGKAGNRAYYSNFGARIALSAPGGDDRADGDTVLSTSNTGTGGAGAESYAYSQGTSMAAPQVAGVLALVLSVNPRLTAADAARVLSLTARPFPAGSTCATGCGAGIVDAARAVGEAVAFKPDLTVRRLTVLDHDVGLPGVPVLLRATLHNGGKAPAGAPIRVRVYLIPEGVAFDPASGAGGRRLVEAAYERGSIPAGGEGMLKLKDVLIPADVPAGRYRLMAVAASDELDGASVANSVSPPVALDVVNPAFTLQSRSATDLAPTRLHLTLATDDRRVMRALRHGRGWEFLWSIPADGRLERTDRDRAVVRFDAPSSGEITASATFGPTGFTREARLSYRVLPPAAYTLAFRATADNRFLRSPTVLRLAPLVEGGHPYDTITSYAWSAAKSSGGEPPLTSRRQDASLRLTEGAWDVSLVVRSKLGQEATHSERFVIVANQAPVCSLDHVHLPARRSITFVAGCRDADGRVRSFAWEVDGQAVTSPSDTTLTRLHGASPGEMNVTVRATDDSGGIGTASVRVPY